jgi:hypothetical protein
MVSPAVPLVTDTQLTANTCTRNRNATVMITNAGPDERRDTSPSTRAISAATTPATGTHHQMGTSGLRAASTPMV